MDLWEVMLAVIPRGKGLMVKFVTVKSRWYLQWRLGMALLPDCSKALWTNGRGKERYKVFVNV
jgi:hypothetical protein